MPQPVAASLDQRRSLAKADTDVAGGDLNRQLRRRSEEHTSEFQSPCNLVCRLLLEKKKKEEARRAAGDEASGARATAPQSVGRALLLVTPPSQRGGCRAAAAARHESGDAVG